MAWDALSFVQDYHVQYWTEGNNVQDGWVNIRCCMCNEDKSNHGGFNPVVGYYNCWKCGGSSISSVIKRLLGVDEKAANNIFFEYSGRASTLRKLNKKEANKKAVVELPGGPLERIHKKYLRGKDYKPNFLAEKYGLQGTGITGPFKYRLIIPIIYKGVLVSFQGRDVTGRQDLRYKNCLLEESRIHYKHILYNLDNCKGSRIAVVEGGPDVWRMGDGFASTFSSTVTEQQIVYLSQYREVLFLFDPEKQAQQRALQAAKKLSALGVYSEVIDLETDCDPGELSDLEALKIRRELGM